MKKLLLVSTALIMGTAGALAESPSSRDYPGQPLTYGGARHYSPAARTAPRRRIRPAAVYVNRKTKHNRMKRYEFGNDANYEFPLDSLR